MIEKPANGWSSLNLTTEQGLEVKFPFSYVDDVPLLLIEGLIDALTNVKELDLSFDAEGWNWDLNSTRTKTSIVTNKEPQEQYFFELGILELAKGVYRDFIADFEEWVDWDCVFEKVVNSDGVTEVEPVLQYREEKRRLKGMLNSLLAAIEVEESDGLKQLFVISKGSYGEDYPVGYVTSKEEAEAYCAWGNKYDGQWDQYSYYTVKPLDLAKEQAKSTVVYKFVFEGWDELFSLEPQLSDSIEEPCLACEVDNDYFFFNFEIISESESEAKLKAYEMLAQVKAVYEEKDDLNLAMDSIDGFVKDYRD